MAKNVAQRFALTIPAGKCIPHHLPWDVGPACGGLEWSVVVLEGLTVDIKVTALVSAAPSRNPQDTSRAQKKQPAERKAVALQEGKQVRSLPGSFEPESHEQLASLAEESKQQMEVVELVFDFNNTSSWFTPVDVEIVVAPLGPPPSRVRRLPSLAALENLPRAVCSETEQCLISRDMPEMREGGEFRKELAFAAECDCLAAQLDAWLKGARLEADRSEGADWFEDLQEQAQTLRDLCQRRTREAHEGVVISLEQEKAEAQRLAREAEEAEARRAEEERLAKEAASAQAAIDEEDERLAAEAVEFARRAAAEREGKQKEIGEEEDELVAQEVQRAREQAAAQVEAEAEEARRAEEERAAKEAASAEAAAAEAAATEAAAKEAAARRAEEERLAKEAAQKAEEERIAREAAEAAEAARAAEAAEAARREEEERRAREAAEAARQAEEERLAREAVEEALKAEEEQQRAREAAEAAAVAQKAEEEERRAREEAQAEEARLAREAAEGAQKAEEKRRAQEEAAAAAARAEEERLARESEQPAAEDPAAEEAPLPAGWESAVDVGTGNTYYFNRATGETLWERPEADEGDAVAAVASNEVAEQAELPPGWDSALDPGSGKTYYFKRSTGETLWEPPKVEPDASAAAQAQLPPGWESAVDAGTGNTYYFNRSTGQTLWEPPGAHADAESDHGWGDDAGFESLDDEETPAAAKGKKGD